MGRLDPGCVEVAKASAAATLPLELMRLGAGKEELAVQYGTSTDDLATVLTDRFLEGLLNPLGSAAPKLTASTAASEGRIIADLYWRCLVAMHMMPLASLKALAKHHTDLRHHLPPEDAEEATQRIALVTALLPRFSMACVTPEEAEAAAKRREEIEAIQKERERVEAEEAAEEAAGGQPPLPPPEEGQVV